MEDALQRLSRHGGVPWGRAILASDAGTARTCSGLIVLFLVSGFEQVGGAQPFGQSAALATCGAKPARGKSRIRRAIR